MKYRSWLKLGKLVLTQYRASSRQPMRAQRRQKFSFPEEAVPSELVTRQKTMLDILVEGPQWYAEPSSSLFGAHKFLLAGLRLRLGNHTALQSAVPRGCFD
jgi:hypothetical protein